MKFIQKQWFLFALVIAVAFGFALADVAAGLSQSATLKWGVVAATMLLMALPVELNQFRSRIARPLAPLTGCFFNAVVSPMMIWPLAMLLPDGIAAAMVIVFASPCTLASASVWTGRYGGDDSVSIFVTILTNGMCFWVSPLTVFLLIGQSVPGSVLSSVVWNLLFCIVVPIIAAQTIRALPRAGRLALQWRRSLRNAAQVGILIIVFIGSIGSAQRMNAADQDAADQASTSIAVMVTSVVVMLAVHALVLVFAKLTARGMGMPHAEQVAVAFSGSQKTLMVGLAIAAALQVPILPIIAFHSIQLVIDTVIAEWWFSGADA